MTTFGSGELQILTEQMHRKHAIAKALRNDLARGEDFTFEQRIAGLTLAERYEQDADRIRTQINGSNRE